MYTYTTPTITCTFENAEFTNADYIRVVIGDGKACVIRQIPIEDVDIENSKAIITLTQIETAKIGSGTAAIQARIHYNDGTVVGTNKVFKQLHDMLDKVVI